MGGSARSASPDAKIRDCGCGGGANIRRLLKKYPQSIVKGVDYSAVSVEKARRLNRDAIADERCAVWQGSVAKMIFAASWFDAVTAFETVYFWPELTQSFREVLRVLKPGGTFLICNECGGDNEKDEKWTERIEGMTIYKDTELKAALEQLFGVLSLSTIKNIVSSLGLDEAWWTNITVAAMICLFLVVQSLVLSRKNKNEN